jgi:chromosome segregation ATPase
MADEPVTPTDEPTEPVDDQRVPYERFQQANKKAKEAADRSKALEKDLADLRAQMEERETAGLPELDRERKRAEQLEKRAAEAEQRAQDTENRLNRSQRERWVTAAAKDFTDPEDASAFVNLDEIEDEKDAERAVKGLAKRKPHLLKAEDRQLPGRVLRDGQTTTADPSRPTSNIDLSEEARMLSEGLRRFATPQ